MEERRSLAIMVGDKLTLPDENGVETGYVIERIMGTPFEANIIMKNANGIPGPERTVVYGRVD